MSSLSRSSALLIALVLTGCTVGPNHVRPEPQAPNRFSGVVDGLQAAPAETEFWHSFEDAQLSQLIDEALTSNRDLHGALARLQQSLALARVIGRDRWPTVTATAGHSDSRLSEVEWPGGLRSDVYDAGLLASWELDLFGRVRRSIETSDAEAAAAEADMRAVQVSIAAEVASQYFLLRGRQAQLRIASDNAGNQRETLRLTEARLEAGTGNQFDTARARAQLESTLARIPALEAGIAEASHRLAVLTGRTPEALNEQLLTTSAPLSTLPETVAAGTPAELLRRRPDIQAAEQRLAAATARIGVVTADLFPRVTLNGSLSTSSDHLGDLFSAGTRGYGFGPSIGWAFLDLGRVRASIDAADAAASGQLAAYENTVLQALEEAENALVNYAKARREREHLLQAGTASEQATRLAQLRFEAGSADLLQVLDAQRSQLVAEDQIAASHTRASTALVAVYRSVAGGWPAHMPEAMATAGTTLPGR